MKRRSLFKNAGKLGVGTVAAAASTVVAAPAIAQSMPEIRWRCASSFPKSLDTIYGAAEQMAKRVSEATDGKFQIRVFAGGEIVPALQVVDAVQANTVECGHTAPYYYVGKDPTFAFQTAIPFGLNARQQIAWMYFGGGRELMNDFLKEYSIHSIPCGNTGAQMGGWFRKEIKTIDDMKGLKMRIGGFAGQVLAKVGLVPQQLAASDIYPALEKGTIDAAEWVGPYDDEKLGFNKVAPNYYYPGWWEGGPELDLYINTSQWEKLPKHYQAIVESASAEAHNWMIAKYDAQNPAALRRLVAGGTKLQAFPTAVMEACFAAAEELYTETSAKNPKFKKIYDAWKPFRSEQFLWAQIADNTFDNFMVRQYRANKL
ncbi:MAG: TRAP transporter substrate-binding protein [Alphaproteobacteria bacterium]|nr:TRAP transporter substrate-binding protein [Alphaproteobacteria bacterium]